MKGGPHLPTPALISSTLGVRHFSRLSRSGPPDSRARRPFRTARDPHLENSPIIHVEPTLLPQRRCTQATSRKLLEAWAHESVSSTVLDERLDHFFFATPFHPSGATANSTVRGGLMRTFSAIALGVVLS